MSAPLVVGAVCGRPGCGHGEDLHDGICFGTACECVRFVGPEGAVSVPVGPEPQASVGYPPALPWAALLDDEGLEEFLAELTASIVGHDGAVALAEIERTCSTWRLIAGAQHGHNTAPGPDAVTRVFSPVASLREPEGEHWAAVHRSYRVPRDLPETGGAR